MLQENKRKKLPCSDMH
uniref:Uncharacterized protein n=1 Tax=Arundo donax TaxID=35708 RepID=A0A0A9A681_ARUDO